MKLLVLSALVLALLAAPAQASQTGVVVSDDGRITARGEIRPDDRFRVGSVTKTFVSTTILQLEAEGRLSLDDPAERYVPGVGAIPLRALLNHTSGLNNHSEDPQVFEGWPLRRWEPRQLVDIGLAMPRKAGFAYSNTNYVILGLVVEAVTRRPLERELERRIIKPLKLRYTSYDEGPRVRGVVRGTAAGEDVTVQDTSWAGAAGSLVSTGRDLARFYGSLDRLLTRKQLKAMRGTGEYGLGLFSVQTPCGRAWGHNGAVPGYLTHAFTRGDRTVVVLVDEQPTDERPAVRRLTRALCA
ncbi:beta-lactamase family protein [Solirubrobacter sp. CPCC 204708]|uniref:Beta-lactamase family protein n=1 Tax=Solirubrobacter deserti TaxID=2282478 RepID=A0ABT4RFM1_9ACTN|nr:serine hydrolase domain-containing protein [Solirubrobacter deserti]MBE2318078.1 beta-lactamase family protein [Solirubrobacter deserti]MDA0137356.1 beta-lactamase family protein [Solirubrobacter deserti]